MCIQTPLDEKAISVTLFKAYNVYTKQLQIKQLLQRCALVSLTNRCNVLSLARNEKKKSLEQQFYEYKERYVPAGHATAEKEVFRGTMAQSTWWRNVLVKRLKVKFDKMYALVARAVLHLRQNKLRTNEFGEAARQDGASKPRLEK